MKPDGLVIEPAQRGDVPDIVALLSDDFLGKTRESGLASKLNDYYAAFDAIAADQNNTLFVARLNGAIVGCFQFTILPGLSFGGKSRGQIESVRTRNEFRGQGIGAGMMHFAIELARARGCCLVQLSTNKQRADAHRFYERLGFAATHQGMKLMLNDL